MPSPDGRLIAYQGQDWSTDTYVENGLYVMNTDGSNPRRIAGELGRSLGNLTWAPDGSGLYFNAPMKGTSNVWFAPLQGEAGAGDGGEPHALLHLHGRKRELRRHRFQLPRAGRHLDLQRPGTRTVCISSPG